MIYFTSDQHWGHKAVIWMSQRPFENVHEMNMYMIDKWNEVVGPDDDVYHLGDLMYKMNPNTFIHNVLNNLNGNIHLIYGNHDKRHLNKFKNHIDFVEKYHELYYTHEEKEYRFILFHNPIYSWDGMWRNSIHLHGHTHYNTNDLYFESIGHKLNVNCEFFDYKPISIVDIINQFKDKKIEKS